MRRAPRARARRRIQCRFPARPSVRPLRRSQSLRMSRQSAAARSGVRAALINAVSSARRRAAFCASLLLRQSLGPRRPQHRPSRRATRASSSCIRKRSARATRLQTASFRMRPTIATSAAAMAPVTAAALPPPGTARSRRGVPDSRRESPRTRGWPRGCEKPASLFPQ